MGYARMTRRRYSLEHNPEQDDGLYKNLERLPQNTSPDCLSSTLWCALIPSGVCGYRVGGAPSVAHTPTHERIQEAPESPRDLTQPPPDSGSLSKLSYHSPSIHHEPRVELHQNIQEVSLGKARFGEDPSRPTRRAIRSRWSSLSTPARVLE